MIKHWWARAVLWWFAPVSARPQWETKTSGHNDCYEHVLPVDDALMHEEDDDCPCNPDITPRKTHEGTIVWRTQHYAWDGRERVL